MSSRANWALWLSLWAVAAVVTRLAAVAAAARLQFGLRRATFGDVCARVAVIADADGGTDKAVTGDRRVRVAKIGGQVADDPTNERDG